MRVRHKHDRSVEWAVRLRCQVRSARIVERPAGIIELDLGIERLTGTRWYYLPERIFKLIADNQRRLRDQGKGDYTMQDGRNVCRVVQGDICYFRLIRHRYQKEEWFGVEIISVG